MTILDTIEKLEAHYPVASGRSLAKELTALDPHCRNIISLSPFLLIASQSKSGDGDCTPRGDPPGFVQVIDDTTIAIPDRPGNNRLDTLRNIVENPQVGLLFLIPGVNECLRINGRAEIHTEKQLLERFLINGKSPRSVILVRVQCAKALMRSKLWDEASKIDRSQLPTMGEWMKDHTSSDVPTETTEDMEARYAKVIY